MNRDYYDTYLHGNYDKKPKRVWEPNDYADHDVVSVGAWVLVLIITVIPFIGVIVLLILAFGDYNKNLRNYAKAALILFSVGLILNILFN